MQTHTHRAHWYAQETVAKTILAAAHAKRLAAQWRLSMCGGPHTGGVPQRQVGEGTGAMRAMRGCRSLSTTRGAP